MDALAAGAVVLVPFPFSDLSQSKLRPAVVLTDADRGDWVLCQITSNLYADRLAVPLTEEDFDEGSLYGWIAMRDPASYSRQIRSWSSGASVI